jgi:hypothetical protein
MMIDQRDLTQALIEASSKISHVGWLIDREPVPMDTLHTIIALTDDLEIDLIRLRKLCRHLSRQAGETLLREHFDRIEKEMVTAFETALKEAE